MADLLVKVRQVLEEQEMETYIFLLMFIHTTYLKDLTKIYILNVQFQLLMQL